MHTMRLLLVTTKNDKTELNKRFVAMTHIHNVLVKHGIEQMSSLKEDIEYQDLLKRRKNPRIKKRKKLLNELLKNKRLEYGLSEAQFQSYIKKCGKQFNKKLSSGQVQKEVTRVWQGVSKCLFGNGKKIHYKKNGDILNITGKSPTNGIKFDKDKLAIDWQGLHIKCKKPTKQKDIDYLYQTIDHDVKYCEVQRKMFNNGWHYYLVLYLDGDAPLKPIEKHDGTMGIDPGVSSIAAVADERAILKELDPNCKKYNKKIVELQQAIDRSKRLSNPNKYNPNGTINRKDKERWKYSKSCLKKMRMLKTLFRKKAAYIKQSHNELCDLLLQYANYFYIEKMNFKALQRRSKNTERSDKTTDIKQKNGSVKTVNKFKRKKRFGKSLNNRAPALFDKILNYKAKRYGFVVEYIDTKTYKASQFNHKKNIYEKVPLGQRTKLIGKDRVQRDLYSAFLIKNTLKNLKRPNKSQCKKEFKHFIELQNKEINELKQNNVSMKQCFGF